MKTITAAGKAHKEEHNNYLTQRERHNIEYSRYWPKERDVMKSIAVT